MDNDPTAALLNTTLKWHYKWILLRVCHCCHRYLLFGVIAFDERALFLFRPLTQTLQLQFCLWGFFCSVGSSWAVVVSQDILSCWGTNIFRVCRCGRAVWLEGLRQFGSIWMSGSEFFQHSIALWQDGQRITGITVRKATKGGSRASFPKCRGRTCILH